jgi:hypothetical protein
VRAKFAIEKPDDIDCTMKITMSLGQWKKLRAQLPSEWPSMDLYRAIGDLVGQAEQTFYVSEAEEG